MSAAATTFGLPVNARTIPGLVSRRIRPMTSETVQQAVRAVETQLESFLYATFTYGGQLFWVSIDLKAPQTLEQLASKAAAKVKRSTAQILIACGRPAKVEFRNFVATNYRMSD